MSWGCSCRPSWIRVGGGCLLVLVMAAGWPAGPARGTAKPGFEDFVRRDGDVLKDGDREFRFLSFNVPNLHYVEDDMRFGQSMPFRLPDAFEIDDALGSIEQMGGQVVRTYTLSVKKSNDPEDLPRYLLGPGQFNEEAFRTLDRVIAAAHRHRVRLIIPFVDMWSWWGGVAELAAFHGKKAEEVWTDPQLIQDYKDIITYVISRVNTVTGVRYRDDKAILAWETGNELHCPPQWTREMVAHIKSQDPQHLALDGTHREVLLPSSLEDANIDLVQTHHYEKDPRAMIGHILESAKMARSRKPYFVGEFGFLGTEALGAVMDTVRDQKLTGALLWSLRYHSRDGGFYWHHEPAGGDYFKAYHWPGFAAGEQYDERRLMQDMRERAFAIRGMTAPPLPKPPPPRLLSVTAGGQMTWQGSVGASAYDVQRVGERPGPWTTVGTGVSDARVQYRPLFVDESLRPGKTYYYRVVACNASGSSKPSNVVGPVRMTHRTLVDELWNDSRIFLKEGSLQFVENQARKFKEDCHRLAGRSKSAIVYRGPGGIGAVRVFLFTQSDQPAVQLLFSTDGRTFEPVESAVAGTATHGEDAYGFWKARLVSAEPGAAGGAYVKIEFLAEAQLARVEVDYDVAE
jgi:mannan endo-1,4-beta-mannosidase